MAAAAGNSARSPAHSPACPFQAALRAQLLQSLSIQPGLLHRKSANVYSPGFAKSALSGYLYSPAASSSEPVRLEVPAASAAPLEKGAEYLTALLSFSFQILRKPSKHLFCCYTFYEYI